MNYYKFIYYPFDCIYDKNVITFYVLVINLNKSKKWPKQYRCNTNLINIKFNKFNLIS